MTIRCGMAGDNVKRIEEFLAGQKLYMGPIDSSFGGGLESAVKKFQNLHQLAASGLVDSATWTLMFPGETEPECPLATTSLAERCLALTGSFETGKFHPDCFCGIAGDFDGMGISYGCLQWNVGQGSLQPIVKQMFEQHPELTQSIFHEHYDNVRALAADSLPDQLAFSRSIQIRAQVVEPWLGMLITMGRTSECQAIQTEQAANVFNHALEMCRDFEVMSERAAALMFDIATQNGSISSATKSTILADYNNIPQADPALEVKRLASIANRVAEASRTQFVADVRVRKLAVANGTGTVHDIFYDLEDMFGITLNAFQH